MPSKNSGNESTGKSEQNKSPKLFNTRSTSRENLRKNDQDRFSIYIYKSKNSNSRCFFTHENLNADINFGTMEVTFLRNGRIKQIKPINSKFKSTALETLSTGKSSRSAEMGLKCK